MIETTVLQFVEKNVRFRNVIYNIKALDHETLAIEEKRLIDSLMAKFQHITVISIDQVIEHANGNNINVNTNSEFGAFLCTVP